MVQIYYDKTHAEDEYITGTATNVSDISVTSVHTLITNNKEPNYISFDGLGIDLQNDNQKFYETSDYCGAIFNSVSNEDGNIIGSNDYISVNVRKSHVGNISIKFYGNCCKSLAIQYTFEDGTTKFEVTSVDSDFVTFTPSYTGFKMFQIFFRTTAIPHQYIKVAYIRYGDIIVLDKLKSVELMEEINILSDDLPINELSFSAAIDEPLDFSNDDIINIYSNGKYYGTFYFTEVERTAKNVYSIKARNSIEKLNNVDFVNWKSTAVDAEDFLTEITTLSGIECSAPDIDLTNYTVFGHMPVKTARYALCGYAFACCFVLDTSRSEKIIIKEIPTSPTHILTTKDKRIIGDSTYTKNKSTSSAIYTYPYSFTSEETTFEPQNEKNKKTTIFFDNAPFEVFDIAGGHTIYEQSYNHIVFTANTYHTTFTGYKIDFNKKSETIEAEEISGKQNEKKYDEFNLKGNLLTAENNFLIQKKKADIAKYISSGGTIKAKIRLRNEKVGDLIQIETAFDGIKTGIITSMNIHFGYEDTADIEVTEWQIG